MSDAEIADLSTNHGITAISMAIVRTPTTRKSSDIAFSSLVAMARYLD